MKIEKLTEEYTLEGFTVDFGEIPKKVPVSVDLKFTDINSKIFNIRTTCGCSKTTEKIENSTTVLSKITYNASSNGKFDKTIVLTNGAEKKELKLIGTTV